MKTKLAEWLDTECNGRPRSHWIAVGLLIGIVINLVIISLL